MMEFYSEYKRRSRKERKCECCGGEIHAGDIYWRESGKFDGDFFSRDMHDICHGMEVAYCWDVDNEFSWDGAQDHAQDLLCYDCEHGCRRDDEDGWTECPHESYLDCPKFIERFSSTPRRNSHE